ncbi:hypothetical protein HMPREF1981_03563 [Bacteroides pyogenes F0041]|uniref:Uncharacterized protein n=2 Tax=Bacteroides pyogenes TaxID=310300 RepID=U2DMB7_9BACE|nr:hypothetical protein HMPREF1981_03563 [Bacteroides pyogenes F0041]GAE20062.1 peptidase M16 domain protein [Bacteroides pyogenes DSM 20611 = JCM 6294]
MSKIPPQRIRALFHVFKLLDSDHCISFFFDLPGKDKEKSATFVSVT